jgi:hypothetical protein
MLRYLVLSAVIVLGIAVLVTAWANRELIRIKIASVYARVPPKPEAAVSVTGSTAPFEGDAAWALSALPECLTQVSESRGPLPYLVAHLPAGAQAVVPPASFSYGDCTISLTGDEAVVRRGADRFRIPPRVRFYRTPGSLAVLRQSPSGNDLRVYQPVSRPLSP